jgi:hypothetical protein
MIGPISRARFEKRFPGGIPNPEIVLRHWFENSTDKTLGFVALNLSLQTWAAAVLKRHHGQYRVWRQTAALETEREAVDALFQLFGLTDRGYRETLAEREFFGQAGGRKEFIVHSEWGFDPGYDAETRGRLEAPIEAITQELFREIYPRLRPHLEANPGQKSTLSIQVFPTPLVALNAPVLGLFYWTAGLNTGPSQVQISVGRQSYIEAEHGRIIQHWRELGSRPGARMLVVEGFE